MIAITGTSDQPCWLAEASKLLFFLLSYLCEVPRQVRVMYMCSPISLSEPSESFHGPPPLSGFSVHVHDAEEGPLSVPSTPVRRGRQYLVMG